MTNGRGGIVVTGAASGIGLAVAEMLVERWPGITIGAVDLPGDSLTALGSRPRVELIPCDVSNQPATASAIRDFSVRFQLLGLVNAAGNRLTRPSLDLKASEWASVLGVHLDGSFFMAQAVAGAMVRDGKGGSIVNLSSVAMEFGWPSRLPYSVAKAGIVALTHTLAVEWAPHGIRVNAVAPGYVDTPMIRKAAAEGAFDVQARIEAHALKRFAHPNEIAEVVEFLLSDRSSFITGEVIRVDGGFSVVK